jgi:hypothetical protein
MFLLLKCFRDAGATPLIAKNRLLLLFGEEHQGLRGGGHK